MALTEKNFKETLNLPRTDFPIRAQSKVDDPALLQRWDSLDLYAKATVAHQGEKKYVLHAGPPYANGHIHLGHAYSWILKDIMVKAYRMAGYQAPFTPGWDCHGLPIEIKVQQEQPHLSRIDLKKACRLYAQQWVDTQRDEFKKLGIVADWQNPYITMSPTYEAAIVRAFGDLVQKGYIERSHKTVSWCASCKTTLATAEVEYKDRKDPSMYVQFKLRDTDAERLFPHIQGPIDLLIWTTTPWTLPLNRAVMLKKGASYQVLSLKGKNVVVGLARAEAIAHLLGEPVVSLATISSHEFEGAELHHPFIDMTVPILLEDEVGLDEGTACVHMAPGCGPVDYEIGVKRKLEIFSPLTPDGRYAHAIEPSELQNMSIADGQIWVIKKLAALDRLLYKASINHSYPHCWRCHQGLMFRATQQWFCDLSKDNLKERALKAIESITFIPDRSQHFLKATIESRWEWCLSRQRVWGVPIPALICKECDTAFTSSAFIYCVAENIEREGIEYWDRAALEHLVTDDIYCRRCNGRTFSKEMDILDVWFESGVSHYAVLRNNPLLSYPADLYLEGVDQHRGWFQSSLLTSMALEREACTRGIMTHGFTVDAKGQKMSKSLGNVVSPQEIIDKIGTDGLRLWVASIGSDRDAVVSDALLSNVAEVYRKIRNTCRFLLSNLYDFDYEKDALALDSLLVIDRYALTTLFETHATIERAYHSGDLTAVFHALADYSTTHLSSFYLDIVKDRLYVAKADGKQRRSAQTACYMILDVVTHLIAPIMSFAAELISDAYQKNKQISIHLQTWNMPALSMGPQASFDSWRQLKEMRSALLKSIELLREQGVIKHSLEAEITVFFDYAQPRCSLLPQIKQAVEDSDQTWQGFLQELLIVSSVTVATSAQNLSETTLAGVYAKVEQAKGVKCPRCWQWHVSSHPQHVCSRCAAIIAVE